MPRTPSAGTAFAKAPAQILPNAIVAAAIPVNGGAALPRRRKAADPWQMEAWDMHDLVGALRYASNWYSNACSKARLKVGQMNEKGEFVADTTGDAFAALEEVKRSFGGEAELIKALALHDFIAGECYMVSMPPTKVTTRGNRVAAVAPGPDGDDIWVIASIEEINKVGDVWQLTWDDDERIELDDNDVVIRIWTPSPRKRWHADSPVKAALPDLREIRTAGRHISAQMFSRLAGAGVLLLPNEVTFAKPANTTVPDGTAADPNADPLMLNIGTTMMSSIDDPGSVAAFVPILLKVPGEHVNNIKHLKFWSDLDEKALAIRQDATKNLATTLDMPAEVLLGTADMNHWGAWQVDESAVKTHIEPGLGRLAANLTLGFLRAIKADPNKIIAFDTSGLRLRPNRSKEALELYDRGELNGDALRRETGFDSTDGYETDKEGFQQWLLKKMAGGSSTPEMVAWAVEQIAGLTIPLGLAETVRVTEQRPDPSLVDHPEQGPPQPDDAQTASLVATCEALLFRAMERAGNRAKNQYNVRTTGVASEEMHLHVKVQPEHVELLLSGAWKPLATMLHRTGYNAEQVAPALDSYAKMLLVEQFKYDPDSMQRHLFKALGI